MKKSMSITEKFDRAKKQFEKGDLETGYMIGNFTFHSYYTNQNWQEFVEKMPQKVRDQFYDGKGSEMKEYTRKGHTFPPKMASYASSSRFMISQGCAFIDFEYEKQLRTGLGGYPANLDGHLKVKNIFVEAKCHEFYNYSKPKLREGLEKLLEDIKANLDNKLDYEIVNGTLSLKWDGKDTGNFDFKQMLCHLSGLANMVLGGGEKTVNFIYLVYHPSEDLLGFVEKPADRQRIQELYDEEKRTAETIDFPAVYEAILRYFNATNKKYGHCEAEISEMVSAFSFRFCTQDDFKSVVDSL